MRRTKSVKCKVAQSLWILPLLSVLFLCEADAKEDQAAITRFKERITGFGTVHIVVDALPAWDVQGDTDGVYEDFPEPLSGIVADIVKNSMIRKDFEVRSVQTQSGMLLPSNSALFYAKDDAITDRKLEPVVYQTAGIPWMDEANRAFFVQLVAAAQSLKSKRATQNGRLVVPEALKPHQDDLLVFVRVVYRHVGKGKSLAWGALTGGLTGAAGIGLSVAIFPTSGSTVEAYVVDLRTGELIWYAWEDRKNNAGEFNHIPSITTEVMSMIPGKNAEANTLTKDEKKKILAIAKEAYANVISVENLRKAQQLDEQQYQERVAQFSEAEQRQMTYFKNIEILRAKYQSKLLSGPAYKISVLREKLAGGWWFAE